MTLGLVVDEVYLGARGVDLGAQVIQGVLGIGHLDHRREVLGRSPPFLTADGRGVLVGDTVGIGAIVSHLEPGEQIAVNLYSAGETPLARSVHDTLRVVVREGGEVGMALVATGNGKTVVLVYGPAGNLLYPVGSFAEAERVGIDGAAQRSRGTNRGMTGVLAEIGVVVAVLGELGCVHYIEASRQFRYTQVGLEGDARMVASHTRLGGDDNNAVRAPGTVYCGGGGVLQDRDGSDIVRVDIVQVVDGIGDSVHDDERLVGSSDGTCSADTDGGGGAGSSVGGHEVRTGDTALKGVVHRKHRSILDIGHLDGSYRTGEVGFLGRTVTDDNQILYHIGLFAQGKVDGLAAVHLFRNTLISKTLHRKGRVGRGFDGISAVQVGGNTVPGAFHQYRRTGERLSGSVAHNTGDGDGLRPCGSADYQRKHCQNCLFNNSVHRLIPY